MKKTRHVFTSKFFHWIYCSKCGLVLLKNEASKKESFKFCDSDIE